MARNNHNLGSIIYVTVLASKSNQCMKNIVIELHVEKGVSFLIGLGNYEGRKAETLAY